MGKAQPAFPRFKPLPSSLQAPVPGGALLPPLSPHSSASRTPPAPIPQPSPALSPRPRGRSSATAAAVLVSLPYSSRSKPSSRGQSAFQGAWQEPKACGRVAGCRFPPPVLRTAVAERAIRFGFPAARAPGWAHSPGCTGERRCPLTPHGRGHIVLAGAADCPLLSGRGKKDEPQSPSQAGCSGECSAAGRRNGRRVAVGGRTAMELRCHCPMVPRSPSSSRTTMMSVWGSTRTSQSTCGAARRSTIAAS